ncbi:MAG TPA: selenium metabolism-associated LysR family transcriptional regulator [Candidatus Limnocylindrales bacterium]|nr:selenium metabolism-associated LysR family transcriptional regulator [Candidatus Limnocylindrales bacterium]
MDIRDLEVFLAVAKYLNFTRAGEEIHLSQPSISVRIHQLEEELGVKLFEQAGKKVLLTEAGHLLVPYARRVVADLENVRQVMKEYQGLEQGSLRIGASTTPGMYLIPRIITQFKGVYPKIDISLSIENTRRVEEGIVKNEFDLGFVGGHLINEEVETIPWLIDEIVLVVPSSHPLALQQQIKLIDLAKERLIFREPGSATRAVIENNFRTRNLQVKAAVELGNPEAVKQAVVSGLGIAFLSKFSVETELKAKVLVIVKVQELSISRELKMVYRKGKHLSRATKAFIEMAKQGQ